MNFKIVSKNNIGIVLSLLLVILLSQSKIFNFLLVTPLGRFILIALILSLAYINKILGVVAVLVVIIIFSQSNIGRLEGFTENKTTNENEDKNKTVPATDTQTAKITVKPPVIDATASTAIANAAATAIKTTTTSAEGFDIIGTENYIKRGKQSNQIPVSQHMKESENILPFEGSFNDLFYSFVK